MSTSNSIDQEVLLFIIKNLVNHPDEVVLERKVDEMGVLLTLSVNAEDMGIVIGRNGSMAKALRTIIKAVGKKHRMMVSLNIIEPAGSNRPARVYRDEDRMPRRNSPNNEQGEHQSHNQDYRSETRPESNRSVDPTTEPTPLSVSDDLAEFAIN
jgi:predicted RNA-binding protein YlqC (UPF0109 family)